MCGSIYACHPSAKHYKKEAPIKLQNKLGRVTPHKQIGRVTPHHKPSTTTQDKDANQSQHKTAKECRTFRTPLVRDLGEAQCLGNMSQPRHYYSAGATLTAVARAALKLKIKSSA